MTISIVSPEEALHKVETSLRLPASAQWSGLTPALIAQALRRAVHILAPCAPYALKRAVVQSLTGLGLTQEDLVDNVDTTLEALIVYGDVLEMRAADEAGWTNSAFVLRPAPPSFIARSNGSIIVLGVAGDDITPLTGEIGVRLIHRGVLRVLDPLDGYDLPAYLRETGLIDLPEGVWLRVPKREDAQAHIDSWHRQLANEPASTHIEGLRILDIARLRSFYPARWVDPGKQHSGIYVARRPQRYGAELWCLADLEEGVATRFLDLVAPGDRIRPCDVAWRIQMAMDARVNRPQHFRCRAQMDWCVFDFYSPLPSWAERHLALTGDKLKGDGCLFSYRIPSEACDQERQFLHEALWLVQDSE